MSINMNDNIIMITTATSKKIQSQHYWHCYIHIWLFIYRYF